MAFQQEPRRLQMTPASQKEAHSHGGSAPKPRSHNPLELPFLHWRNPDFGALVRPERPTLSVFRLTPEGRRVRVDASSMESHSH